ncbi:MAG: sodium/solute symporter [Ignavibacteriae bacterium]|nr:sodium/solute symporter [Ignavibacteriota bacterium]MCB9206442.1 sodium/solute symporter [Ignavibacteriales bacterium]MCB9210694.1 sodium/solute symporter [Ignavibacteriales bacterium]MCB9219655.1 sodium/solute symporter [Ignavibacteriales bacterium]MCB9259957.1 sodium/solute symporter [Ignavibacteriales bacterium]
MSNQLSFLDNFLVLIYFAMVLFIGLIVSKNKDKNIKEYFLAGKNLGWFAIGMSLFATNISSEHLVGLAGAGSIYGLSVGYFEWYAVIILIFLGWFIAPIFIKANVFTVPQYFGKRFDDKSRLYLTIVSIFVYLVVKIGVTILAGSFVLSEVLGWNMLATSILIVLLTGLYTVIGGLNSVVYTQIFQTVLIILGAVLLSVFGLFEIGGFSTLSENLSAEYFSIIKSSSDSAFPWTGILLGAPILGIWYWCADQYIVQRILGAKNIQEARKGTLLAAFLKIIPIFFIIFPGLVVAVLYPSLKGDSAYSLLLSGNILPIGIKGLVIIGFLSAIMSSLSSSFNSAASLFALDIYGLFKPNTSENEIVLVGRLTTMFFVITTIALIPLLRNINNHIYINIQALQAFIAPPIVSVFLIGIFWKKASSKGAIWALTIGGTLGLLKIALLFIDEVWINTYIFLKIFYKINYLHFAIFLFLLSSTVIISFSLFKVKEKYEGQNDNILDISNKGDDVRFSSPANNYFSKEVKINKTKVKSFTN